MTAKPVAEFTAFFADEFSERLRQTVIPGMPYQEVSWDRRAAWLLWVAEGRHQAEPATTGPIEADILGDLL